MMWQIKKLSEVCLINMGQSPASSTYNKKQIGLPFFQGKKDYGEIHPTPNVWCSESIKIVESGDVLISVRAPVGALNIANEKSCIGRGLAGLRANPGLLNQRFLFGFLKLKEKEIVDKGTGSTFTSISKKDIENLEIPLPSLETQKEIVEKLDEKFAKLREAKQLRQEALADTEKILSQTLHEIFEEGKKKGWEESTLGEITEVVGGGTPSTTVRSYWNGVHAWVTPKDLGKLESIYIEKTGKTISEMGLKNSSARLLPTGSVVFSSRAPIGYLAINTVPMATNQGCRNFICSEKIINKFLYYSLIYNREYIKSLGSGSTFAEISGSKLKEVKIIVPNIEEQQKIVARLDTLSLQIATLRILQQDQLADLKKLEKAYLLEAFRGELV